MAKPPKDKSNQSNRSMLGQKTGSMLDKKTNEDYNNEYPDHKDPNQEKVNPKPDDENIGTGVKQTVDKKFPDIKLKKESDENLQQDNAERMIVGH